MGKVVKWLAIVAAGLVVLVGIGAGILLTLLDEDTIKKQLTKVVHETTGGSLEINGALGLSLFPQLGVDVEQLQFTPQNETEALAAIGTLRLGVDFMPLFSGEIKVGEITLEGLKLNLILEEDGTGNWENLSSTEAPPAGDTPPTQTEAPPAEKGEGEAAAMNLAISKLDISNTRISYSDRQTGDQYELTDFHLSSQGVNLSGGSFPANIRFEVNTSTPQLNLVFNMTTNVSGDMQAQILELQGTSADIRFQGEPTNDIPLNAQLKVDARVDMQKETADLQNLALGLEQLKLTGKIAVNQLTSDPLLRGNLQSEAFNPRELATTLRQPLPDFVNDKALTKLRFASDVNYGENAVQLNNLNIVLDETQVNGSVAVTDISQQALVVKLKVDNIDLDHYQLVPEAPAEKSTENKQAAPPPPVNSDKGQAAPSPLLPVDTIKTLNLDADLSLGKLTAAGIVLTEAQMKVVAKNGLLEMRKLSAKLYNGTTNFKASVDVRPKQPDWKFNGNIAGVQVKPLLKATSEDLDWIEGSFNFDGKLIAKGNYETELMQSLSGPANFSLKNGMLREMNVDKMVCQAIALINKKSLSKPFGPDTELKAIDGKLQFGSGQINNESFVAALENTDAKGEGSVGLLDDSVDYRLGIRITGQLEEVDPACEVNKRYKDIYWPFRCKGSLDDEPSKLCGIDSSRMDEIIRKMAEEEVKGRAEDAVNKAIGDGLNRLFGR